ncbi:MAG: hypothetical protein A2X49_01200 [Lentisphaerae bacterium GWF2_52_8]|nr:MAG: hypothetical protein A2X49_01200 [Lentisphaerae bacterium GWF2_52_8]
MRVGISSQAVSAVLNDNPKIRVSGKKRQEIMTCVKELGYSPNIAARTLCTKKTYAIGVLFNSMRDRCYAELVDNIQSYLTEFGYIGHFSFWGTDPAKFPDAYKAVVNRGVDGIISCQYEPGLFKKELPAIIYQGKNADIDSLRFDFEEFGRECFSYLLGLGHRRIGFIGYPASPRYLIYRENLKRHGLEYRPEWTYEAPAYVEHGVLALRHLAEMPPHNQPTAIIAHNDAVAIGAISEAQRKGIRIPADLSIIGFDNIDEAQYCFPALSSFDTKIKQSAKLLVDALLHRINNPADPPKTILVTPELIVRDSCGKLT